MNSELIGKERWKFKDLDDQLSSFHQEWQSDQQKPIMLKMAGKLSGKSNDGKGKNKEQNNHDNCDGCSVRRQGNTDPGGRGRGCGGKNNENSDHLKNIVCYNCDKKGHYSTDCHATKK
jgi:hypothetical protein